MKRIISILIVCVGLWNLNCYALSNVELSLSTDKAIYKSGELIKLSLYISKAPTGFKTNSVSFDISYDGTVLTLNKGDISKDLEEGPVKFTSKLISGKDITSKVNLLFAELDTQVALKKSDKLFTLTFRAQKNISVKNTAIIVSPVIFIDAQGRVYKANEGNSMIREITFNTGISANQSLRFTDVKETHWAKNYIEKLVDAGITSGISKDRFGPDEKVTRAQFTAFICRALKLKKTTYQKEYIDVKAKDWFAGDVAAATAAGLVSGNGKRFEPGGYITREQMCSILVQAWEFQNKKKEDNLKRLEFTDANNISGWARDYVSIAVDKGFVQGNGGKFNPKGFATRAQVAVVIVKLLESP